VGADGGVFLADGELEQVGHGGDQPGGVPGLGGFGGDSGGAGHGVDGDAGGGEVAAGDEAGAVGGEGGERRPAGEVGGRGRSVVAGLGGEAAAGTPAEDLGDALDHGGVAEAFDVLSGEGVQHAFDLARGQEDDEGVAGGEQPEDAAEVEAEEAPVGGGEGGADDDPDAVVEDESGGDAGTTGDERVVAVDAEGGGNGFDLGAEGVVVGERFEGAVVGLGVELAEARAGGGEEFEGVAGFGGVDHPAKELIAAERLVPGRRGGGSGAEPLRGVGGAEGLEDLAGGGGPGRETGVAVGDAGEAGVDLGAERIASGGFKEVEADLVVVGGNLGERESGLDVIGEEFDGLAQFGFGFHEAALAGQKAANEGAEAAAPGSGGLGHAVQDVLEQGDGRIGAEVAEGKLLDGKEGGGGLEGEGGGAGEAFGGARGVAAVAGEAGEFDPAFGGLGGGFDGNEAGEGLFQSGDVAGSAKDFGQTAEKVEVAAVGAEGVAKEGFGLGPSAELLGKDVAAQEPDAAPRGVAFGHPAFGLAERVEGGLPGSGGGADLAEQDEGRRVVGVGGEEFLEDGGGIGGGFEAFAEDAGQFEEGVGAAGRFEGAGVAAQDAGQAGPVAVLAEAGGEGRGDALVVRADVEGALEQAAGAGSVPEAGGGQFGGAKQGLDARDGPGGGLGRAFLFEELDGARPVALSLGRLAGKANGGQEGGSFARGHVRHPEQGRFLAGVLHGQGKVQAKQGALGGIGGDGQLSGQENGGGNGVGRGLGAEGDRLAIVRFPFQGGGETVAGFLAELPFAQGGFLLEVGGGDGGVAGDGGEAGEEVGGLAPLPVGDAEEQGVAQHTRVLGGDGEKPIEDAERLPAALKAPGEDDGKLAEPRDAGRPVRKGVGGSAIYVAEPGPVAGPQEDAFEAEEGRFATRHGGEGGTVLRFGLGGLFEAFGEEVAEANADGGLSDRIAFDGGEDGGDFGQLAPFPPPLVKGSEVFEGGGVTGVGFEGAAAPGHGVRFVAEFLGGDAGGFEQPFGLLGGGEAGQGAVEVSEMLRPPSTAGGESGERLEGGAVVAARLHSRLEGRPRPGLVVEALLEDGAGAPQEPGAGFGVRRPFGLGAEPCRVFRPAARGGVEPLEVAQHGGVLGVKFAEAFEGFESAVPVLEAFLADGGQPAEEGAAFVVVAGDGDAAAEEIGEGLPVPVAFVEALQGVEGAAVFGNGLEGSFVRRAGGGGGRVAVTDLAGAEQGVGAGRTILDPFRLEEQEGRALGGLALGAEELEEGAGDGGIGGEVGVHLAEQGDGFRAAAQPIGEDPGAADGEGGPFGGSGGKGGAAGEGGFPCGSVTGPAVRLGQGVQRFGVVGADAGGGFEPLGGARSVAESFGGEQAGAQVGRVPDGRVGGGLGEANEGPAQVDPAAGAGVQALDGGEGLGLGGGSFQDEFPQGEGGLGFVEGVFAEQGGLATKFCRACGFGGGGGAFERGGGAGPPALGGMQDAKRLHGGWVGRGERQGPLEVLGGGVRTVQRVAEQATAEKKQHGAGFGVARGLKFAIDRLQDFVPRLAPAEEAAQGALGESQFGAGLGGEPDAGFDLRRRGAGAFEQPGDFHVEQGGAAAVGRIDRADFLLEEGDLVFRDDRGERRRGRRGRRGHGRPARARCGSGRGHGRPGGRGATRRRGLDRRRLLRRGRRNGRSRPLAHVDRGGGDKIVEIDFGEFLGDRGRFGGRPSAAGTGGRRRDGGPLVGRAGGRHGRSG